MFAVRPGSLQPPSQAPHQMMSCRRKTRLRSCIGSDYRPRSRNSYQPSDRKTPGVALRRRVFCRPRLLIGAGCGFTTRTDARNCFVGSSRSRQRRHELGNPVRTRCRRRRRRARLSRCLTRSWPRRRCNSRGTTLRVSVLARGVLSAIRPVRF
jgi:hypothetical protein